jgi:hypothetical protein
MGTTRIDGPTKGPILMFPPSVIDELIDQNPEPLEKDLCRGQIPKQVSAAKEKHLGKLVGDIGGVYDELRHEACTGFVANSSSW